MNYIHYEVKALLEAFGYKPDVKEYRTIGGINKVDLYFQVDNGSETMPTRHKDAIAMLSKGYLSEFYYDGVTQHVRMFDYCIGLDPDDDRYECLLHKISLVDSVELLPDKGQEVFVNMGDHFKRFVNWIEKNRQKRYQKR